MEVSLNGLQKQTIESYNRLVHLLNRSNTNQDSGVLKVNGDTLERVLGDLHNNLVYFGALIDPDTGKSHLDGEDIKMGIFTFEPGIED